MSNTSTSQDILVLGGTGKTGSRVVTLLKNAGFPVRVGSRSAVLPFDWENSDTWDAALQGTTAVYIAYHPDVAIPGTSAIMRQLVARASALQVQRLVLLSGRGEEEAEECEQVIMQSGLEWTIVRASWFCQNFSEGIFLGPILSGHMALPAGSVKEPFVDADDIAEVAFVSLTAAGHQGKIYEVTGRNLYTFAEAVAEIAKAAGRAITYEEVPLEEYEAVLREHQLPEQLVWLIRYLFSEVLDGRNARLTDGVQQALGRPPADFAAYARDAAATGVWNIE